MQRGARFVNRFRPLISSRLWPSPPLHLNDLGCCRDPKWFRIAFHIDSLGVFGNKFRSRKLSKNNETGKPEKVIEKVIEQVIEEFSKQGSTSMLGHDWGARGKVSIDKN